MSANDNSQNIKRQENLAQLMGSTGLDALILNAGTSLSYLTGLHFHLSERPVIGIFTSANSPVIILPELEAAKVLEAAYPLHAVTYTEDPLQWQAAFDEGVKLAGLGKSKIGVEDRSFRFLELRLLEACLPDSEFHNAVDITAKIRMYKDDIEQDHLQKAVDIAQTALAETLPLIKIGMSEQEVAAELVLQLFRHGSDTTLPFQPIVSSGPNGANPHAVPSTYKLKAGELLVIDWGACWHGYFSDLTRTFALAEYSQEQVATHETVQKANAAAQAAVGPNVTCSQVDLAARQVIMDAGYGEYFIHRTGHGLGLEVHEEPYIRAGNTMPLEAGMTFTIEPGIYLSGKHGVRIEDDVVVTADGICCFSNFERGLKVIGG